MHKKIAINALFIFLSGTAFGMYNNDTNCYIKKPIKKNHKHHKISKQIIGAGAVLKSNKKAGLKKLKTNKKSNFDKNKIRTKKKEVLKKIIQMD